MKSNISANIYGPPWINVWFGFIMSDKITDSLPYLLRINLAHSIPSWPKPPELNENSVEKNNNYRLEAPLECGKTLAGD